MVQRYDDENYTTDDSVIAYAHLDRDNGVKVAVVEELGTLAFPKVLLMVTTNSNMARK